MSKSIIFCSVVLTLFVGRIAMGPVVATDDQMRQASLTVVDPSF